MSGHNGFTFFPGSSHLPNYNEGKGNENSIFEQI